MTRFPALVPEAEPTRATLHGFAHAVTALARAHAPRHPKWWHASLKLRPTGLVSDAVPIPAGGSLQIHMDFTAHEVVVEATDGSAERIPMDTGLSTSKMGDAILDAARSFGVLGDVDRSRFESEEDTAYDREHAATLWKAFVNVAAVLEAHRRALPGEVGPVQVWPHGFDIAFEWFGTKQVESDEGTTLAQINFGFYPAGDAYCYANPWPFDSDLTERELPTGARWHTEGWKGTELPYQALAEDDGSRLREYYEAVFELAAPTLTD
jgi:hypothetical protein